MSETKRIAVINVLIDSDRESDRPGTCQGGFDETTLKQIIETYGNSHEIMECLTYMQHQLWCAMLDQPIDQRAKMRPKDHDPMGFLFSRVNIGDFGGNKHHTLTIDETPMFYGDVPKNSQPMNADQFAAYEKGLENLADGMQSIYAKGDDSLVKAMSEQRRDCNGDIPGEVVNINSIGSPHPVEIKLNPEPSCNGNCGMNYCDDNGCIDRKRSYVGDVPSDGDDMANTVHPIMSIGMMSEADVLDAFRDATGSMLDGV